MKRLYAFTELESEVYALTCQHNLLENKAEGKRISNVREGFYQFNYSETKVLTLKTLALSNATDYEGSGIFQDDPSDDEDSQDSDRESSATPKINLEAKLGEDLFKSVCGRIGGEKLQKIAVGRWLSFQNKVNL